MSPPGLEGGPTGAGQGNSSARPTSARHSARVAGWAKPRSAVLHTTTTRPWREDGGPDEGPRSHAAKPTPQATAGQDTVQAGHEATTRTSVRIGPGGTRLAPGSRRRGEHERCFAALKGAAVVEKECQTNTYTEPVYRDQTKPCPENIRSMTSSWGPAKLEPKSRPRITASA